MSTTAPPATPQSVTALDNFDESPTTALYRAAIGPINSDYYLPIFKRFEAADRTGPCWNWAACLYTLNWMAFRRLWNAALIYTVVIASVAILVLILGTWLLQLSETSEVLLWLALGVLSFVIPGFYGNAWFHAASRKKMASALAASKTMQEATAQLNRQASSKRYFVGLALANLALTGLIGGAYLLFQQATSPSIKAATTTAPRNVTVGQVQVPAPAVASASAPASAAALTTAWAPASGPVAAASATASEPTRSVASASMPALAKTPATTSASAPVAPAIKDLARSDDSKTTAQTQTMTESVNTISVAARFVPRRPLVPPVDLLAAAPLEAPPTTPPLASTAAAPMKSATASQATASKPKQKSSPAEKAGDEKNFYVNVGLFAQEQNAHQTHTKLVSAGLPAEFKELNMTNGTRIRVRVGPFASESKANAAAKKVRLLKLDAIVTQL